MGKISDAFERHKKEKLVKLKDFKEEGPRILASEDPETIRARNIGTGERFSGSLVMFSSPESGDAEGFKILRGQILFSKDRNMARSVLVTSTFPKEGKTYTAANLATSVALSVDEHVLLIDADLRRPTIHQMFGFPNSQGLHDLLIGRRKFEDIVVRTKIKKLSIIPAGRPPGNPAELICSNMMLNFLDEVTNRYKDRFVIIDSTPSYITAEARSMAQRVDGVIFVVMAKRAPRREIQKAIEALGKEKILGVVFNGYDQVRKSYYKYYRRYYKEK
jgi:protein-tyrosine kinase